VNARAARRYSPAMRTSSRSRLAMAVAALAISLALAAAACSAPRESAPRRARALDALPAAAASELARTGRLARAGSIAGAETQRLPALLDTAHAVGAAELARRPQPLRLVPTARRLGQDVADGLVTGWQLLAGRRPLGEPDDREHRTDPTDERPEATWWQRVRRRLWLWL
jgi:hypothetical protein